MEIELKCPRCGGESEPTSSYFSVSGFDGTRVECQRNECGLVSPYFEIDTHAFEWWAQPFRPADALQERVNDLERQVAVIRAALEKYANRAAWTKFDDTAKLAVIFWSGGSGYDIADEALARLTEEK